MSESVKSEGMDAGLVSVRKNALPDPGVVPSAEGLAIMEAPGTPEEQSDYAGRMTAWLLGLLSQDCSPTEREAWQSGRPPEILERAHDKLNEIMIRNASVYTWRMWWCPFVAEWYQWQCKRKDGLRAIERFHAATENRLRIDQGKAKGKVTQEWVQGRANATPELRRLLKLFSLEVRQRRDRIPTFPEAADRLLQLIDTSFNSGSWLFTNRRWIEGYLKDLGSHDPARAQRIRNGRARAEDLFIGMGAWDLGLTDATFRNYLSKMASSRKTFKQKA